jgi:hypothetical protein
MLVPEGGEPALLRCEALVFLQRVAHGARGDLGVFVVPADDSEIVMG